jgi:MucR family transcriptional regulator, transcriptional regulator of exopolysaccharide biosynthesis
MEEGKTIAPRLIARIVGRYLAHHPIAASDLPNLITLVHRSLAELGQPAVVPASPTSAVAINRSFGRDFVICLDCGWRGVMLRRHLTTAHGQSPGDYRARWGLKVTHPLTAPEYSKRRSTLAKEVGLGRGRQPPQ